MVDATRMQVLAVQSSGWRGRHVEISPRASGDWGKRTVLLMTACNTDSFPTAGASASDRERRKIAMVVPVNCRLLTALA